MFSPLLRKTDCLTRPASVVLHSVLWIDFRNCEIQWSQIKLGDTSQIDRLTNSFSNVKEIEKFVKVLQTNLWLSLIKFAEKLLKIYTRNFNFKGEKSIWERFDFHVLALRRKKIAKLLKSFKLKFYYIVVIGIYRLLHTELKRNQWFVL